MTFQKVPIISKEEKQFLKLWKVDFFFVAFVLFVQKRLVIFGPAVFGSFCPKEGAELG